jgi:hypothetical protein
MESRAARRTFARSAERLRSRILGVPRRPVRALASLDAKDLVRRRPRTRGDLPLPARPR